MSADLSASFVTVVVAVSALVLVSQWWLARTFPHDTAGRYELDDADHIDQ